MKIKQPSVAERKDNFKKIVQGILNGEYGKPPCSQRELARRTGISYGSINSYTKGNANPSKIEDATIQALADDMRLNQMDVRRLIDGTDVSIKRDSIANVYRQVDEFFDTNDRWELFKYLSRLLEKGQASAPATKEPNLNQDLIDAMEERRAVLNFNTKVFYGTFLENFGINSDLWNHILEGALPETNQLGMFAAVLGISVDEVAELLSNEAD